MKLLPENKAVLSGSPIRDELFRGRKESALLLCGFNVLKPVIMVIGGSLGSASINKIVRSALPQLLKDFQVVHICGKDKIDNLSLNLAHICYYQFYQSNHVLIYLM